MITPASADAAATEKDEADALDAMRLPRLVQVSLVLEVVTSWLVYKSFAVVSRIYYVSTYVHHCVYPQLHHVLSTLEKVYDRLLCFPSKLLCFC